MTFRLCNHNTTLVHSVASGACMVLRLRSDGTLSIWKTPPSIQKVCTVFLLCMALLLGASPAFAQGVSLRNLVVDNRGGDIVVRFGVEVDDPDGLARLLQHGEVLGVRAVADISLIRSYWLNRTIAEAQSAVIFRYDAVNNRYTALTAQGQLVSEHAELATLLSKALAEMSLGLGSWKSLVKDESYRINLEIRLSRVDVPAWLKRTLFFWDFDPTPSTHYQLDFNH